MSEFHNHPDTNGNVGPIHRHPEDDPSTDAGQLADGILDWLGSVDPADFSQADLDKLDGMLAGLEAAGPDEGTDPKEALAEFHRKYAPLFEEAPAELPAQTSPDILSKKPSRFRLGRRIAVLAAAVVVLLGCMATTQAFSLSFFDFIGRWTSEIFQTQKDDVPYATIQKVPLAEGETAAYDSLQEAVDAFGITAPLVPQWIPERFILESVHASVNSYGVSIWAEYKENDKYLQIYYCETDIFDSNSVEKDDDTVKSYKINKITHYLMSDSGRQKSVWQSGDIECQIFGNISESEITKIIDSIYEE